MERRNLSEVHFAEVARPVYAVAAPALMSLCVLAVLANWFILSVAQRLPAGRLSPPLRLTLSLAAADAWTSTVIGLGLGAHSYAPLVLGWRKPSWFDCASYALEALRLGGILTSVLHLLALAVGHYAATARPLSYKAWLAANNLRRLHALIAVLWLAPPLLFFAVFGVFHRRTFAARSRCSSDFLDAAGLRLAVFLLIFFPLLLMTVVYVRVALALSTLRRQLNGERGATSPATLRRDRERMLRCTRRVVTTLFTVATFLLGWLPGILLYALTCGSCLYPHFTLRDRPALLFGISISVNLLMISKGLLNPLIYASRIPEIKRALADVFHPGRRRPSAAATTMDCDSSTFRRLSAKTADADAITSSTALLCGPEKRMSLVRVVRR